MDLRSPSHVGFELRTKVIDRDAELLEQWPSHPFGLVEQRGQEMIIRDLLMIVLRRYVLRRLQRLLHFLGELIDSHGRSSLPDKTRFEFVQVGADPRGACEVIASDSLPAYQSCPWIRRSNLSGG